MNDDDDPDDDDAPAAAVDEALWPRMDSGLEEKLVVVCCGIEVGTLPGMGLWWLLLVDVVKSM